MIRRYVLTGLNYKHIPVILLALLITFLLLVPQLLPPYYTYLTILILIFSLLTLSANLLLGHTGLVSFGQASLFASGAYVCAFILLAFPNLLLGIIGGVLFAGIIAMIMGILCVRHTAIYFTMLTLSLGMLIHSVIWRWRNVTGGDDGLVGIPRAPLEIPGIFSLNMLPMENYYYFVLVVTLLAIFIFYRIIKSPLGLILHGIRDSESRVAFTGISVKNYRLIAFVIAGLYAGLGGAMFAPLETVITPTIAHWSFSGEAIMAAVLGGIHTIAGPIVGAMLWYLIKDIIVRFTEYWLIFMGGVLVVLVLGFRGGVVGFLQERLSSWLRLRFGGLGQRGSQ